MVFVLFNFCLFPEVIKTVKLFFHCLQYYCDKIGNSSFEIIIYISSFLNVPIVNSLKQLYVLFYYISLSVWQCTSTQMDY